MDFKTWWHERGNRQLAQVRQRFGDDPENIERAAWYGWQAANAQAEPFARSSILPARDAARVLAAHSIRVKMKRGILYAEECSNLSRRWIIAPLRSSALMAWLGY